MLRAPSSEIHKRCRRAKLTLPFPTTKIRAGRGLDSTTHSTETFGTWEATGRSTPLKPRHPRYGRAKSPGSFVPELQIDLAHEAHGQIDRKNGTLCPNRRDEFGPLKSQSFLRLKMTTLFPITKEDDDALSQRAAAAHTSANSEILHFTLSSCCHTIRPNWCCIVTSSALA
jgi:hypothetical protein